MSAPDINRITVKDLLDNERLGQLYVEVVRRNFRSNDQVSALEFWCFAEKALQEDTQGTPGKLFYALLKANDTSKISEGQERRAMARMPSHKRQELVEYATGGRSAEEQHHDFWGGQNIGFAHSIMMQCFMPHTRPPREEVRRGREVFTRPQNVFSMTHGMVRLNIKAGEHGDPDNPTEMIYRDIPHGTSARLILPYIGGAAISNNNPVVDLGRSLRRHMAFYGIEVGGHRGCDITEQIHNVGTAEFVMADWINKDKPSTRYARVADEFSFWIERDDRQNALWQPEMQLSDRFFQALKERPVPIKMDHLVDLMASPRLMDHYLWLSYRATVEKRAEGTLIPLSNLQPIFGQELRSATAKYKYRDYLRSDLKVIGHLWPDLHASVEKWNLRVLPSKPILPRKIVQAIGLNNGR